MGRSTTNVLRFAKITEDRELGSVMVWLMMACNDLSLANESLGYWRNPRTRKEENRATGALWYFLRLQIAHVCEAMGVIQEIERSDRLRAYVRATDRQTQQSYDALPKIKRNKPFKLMKLIRNKVGFHYDPVWVGGAIKRIDGKYPDLLCTISVGQELLDWHFEPGELVEDCLVVRQIFKIADGADVRVETDKILDDLHKIAATFVEFAGHFIKHHAGARR